MYTDPSERIIVSSLARSFSCPELTMYRKQQYRISRKRTYSGNYSQEVESSVVTPTMTLSRVQSDGDLSRIDKKKTFQTFESSDVFQTKDLLSNLLTALGSITNEDGLYNSQILSERTESPQSLTQSVDSLENRPTRQRAFSDFHIARQDSNDPQIQEYFRNRPKKFSISSVFSFKSESRNRLHTSNTLQVPVEGHNRSFISKINPFKARVLGQDEKRHSVSSLDPQIYLKNTAKGRESRFSLSPSSTENIELLEKTTIADLIRAIEEVEAKSNISQDTPLLEDYKGNLRTRTQNLLSVPTYGSRRGSLRPVPTYTTVFESPNSSSSERESATPSSKMTTPHLMKRSISTMPHSAPSSQILQRTFSLRPSPLTTSSYSPTNAQELSETPIITVQPPNVSESNVLWPPESMITDRSVHELKTNSRRKRADSK